MTDAAVEPGVAQCQPTDPWSPSARRSRLLLVIGWGLWTVVALLVGERQVSLADLEAAVSAGAVHEVRVEGGLGPNGHGFSTVEVHWRRGLVGQTTEIIEARPRSRAPGRSDRGDATAVIEGDLGARLSALQPGLRVEHVARTGAHSSFMGFREPGWVAWPLLGLVLATLMSLVGSPEPWRATRWAWFWLLAANPVGVAAYLLLAGPTPLVPPPRNPARRMTGGVGFLLALILDAVDRTT
jgi:hypothetical protein